MMDNTPGLKEKTGMYIHYNHTYEKKAKIEIPTL